MNTMDFHTVIPARYHSSRLPGKPLLDIGGKPMIQHVYERALEAGSGDVCVATDDERIHDTVLSFGGESIMTSTSHQSGADRVAEVVRLKGWADSEIIVNLQGDEPLMPPDLIRKNARDLYERPDAGIATMATPIIHRSDVFNPNVVKVVTDKNGWALYFSRAPIPWVRDEYVQQDDGAGQVTVAHRHLGMYAYRSHALKTMTAMPACDIEQAESLEQLRALWLGIRIYVGVIDEAPAHGVDTPEDLERLNRMMMR